MVFLLWILGGFFDLHEFNVFFVELYFFVALQFLFFEFFDDAFDFVVLNWHKFELFFVELDFGEKFVIFLFLKFLVLVDILVLAFETVVLLNEFFVAFLELLILVVDVFNLRDLFIGLGEFDLNFLVLKG